MSLSVYIQCQYTRAILKKKKLGWNRFEKLSKFQEFQLSDFTLTCSNEGKVNSIWPDMTYSKELQQKMKMLGKRIFKNI